MSDTLKSLARTQSKCQKRVCDTSLQQNFNPSSSSYTSSCENILTSPHRHPSPQCHSVNPIHSLPSKWPYHAEFSDIPNPQNSCVNHSSYAFPVLTSPQPKYRDVDVNPDLNQLNDHVTVYVYCVEARDTLAGVCVKFGCSSTLVCKSNGLWANDSIQSRKFLLIPIHACSVKAYPVDVPQLIQCEIPSLEHVDWVKVGNISQVIRVGRLAQRELGFFPRTRVKYSSCDKGKPSLSNECRDSVDSWISDDQTFTLPKLPLQNSFQSTVTNERKPTASLKWNDRSWEDMLMLMDSLSTSRGVGSLDQSTSKPGPADDGLSRLMQAYFTDSRVNPSNVSTSAIPGLERIRSFGTLNRNLGTRSGLESVVSESVNKWVRKVATQVSKVVKETSNGVNNNNNRAYQDEVDLIILERTNSPSKSVTREAISGDLIELNEPWELNSSGNSYSYSDTQISTGFKRTEQGKSDVRERKKGKECRRAEEEC